MTTMLKNVVFTFIIDIIFLIFYKGLSPDSTIGSCMELKAIWIKRCDSVVNKYDVSQGQTLLLIVLIIQWIQVIQHYVGQVFPQTLPRFFHLYNFVTFPIESVPVQ